MRGAFAFHCDSVSWNLRGPSANAASTTTPSGAYDGIKPLFSGSSVDALED